MRCLDRLDTNEKSLNLLNSAVKHGAAMICSQTFLGKETFVELTIPPWIMNGGAQHFNLDEA